MKVFLFVFLAFILIDVFIVGYVMFRRFRKKINKKIIGEIQVHWKELIRNPDHRYAVLEADKLLDLALGKMGYSGNLGGKLKKCAKLFSDLDGLWAAHKVRNNIAHQINYAIDRQTYKKTMLSFKRAFKDLHIF